MNHILRHLDVDDDDDKDGFVGRIEDEIYRKENKKVNEEKRFEEDWLLY